MAKNLIIIMTLALLHSGAAVSFGNNSETDSYCFPDAYVKRIEKEVTSHFGKKEGVPVIEYIGNMISGGGSGDRFAVIKINGEKKGFIYSGRVFTCSASGCSTGKGENGIQRSEYFDYMIIFGESVSVEKINILSYQATHGMEITSRGWLKQFTGYNGDKKIESGRNIDAISGATRSVESIISDISRVTDLLKGIESL
ncbi:MAG: FMN-binding protein [Bacteroidales bacterium]|nr:FMN-binding protein [Bacteroidales bacterium]